MLASEITTSSAARREHLLIAEFHYALIIEVDHAHINSWRRERLGNDQIDLEHRLRHSTKAHLRRQREQYCGRDRKLLRRERDVTDILRSERKIGHKGESVDLNELVRFRVGGLVPRDCQSVRTGYAAGVARRREVESSATSRPCDLSRERSNVGPARPRKRVGAFQRTHARQAIDSIGAVLECKRLVAETGARWSRQFNRWACGEA